MTEDDFSLWQAMEDRDQGGNDPNAPALPAAGVNGHAQAVRRRWRRQNKAYERVYSHQDDERIKDMLDALPEDDRRGAEAWALVLRECDQGTTDLDISEIRVAFEKASIEADVGHNEESIIKFSRVLNSINTRLPQLHRYGEEQLAVKMLHYGAR